MVDICARAGGQETGGILIGHYSDGLDHAVISNVIRPPSDSRAGRAWFRRGVVGLNSILNRLWRGRRGYYIGEWHSHPSADPRPSPADCAQMAQIAVSDSYNCPEPILVIIGGGPDREWEFGTFVFPRSNLDKNSEPIEMARSII